MVRVNLTRQAFEAVSLTEPTVSVTRQSVEVLANADEAVAERVNLSRMSYEMIFETASIAAVTRQNVEVLANADEANAEQVDLSRISYECITAVIKRLAVTRQNVEVLANADEANAERVDLSRISFEVLARKGPSPVEPLALADEVDLFMHNWVEQAVLESGWLSDIQQSAANGAEERRGLSIKPLRALTLLWTIDSQTEADRLLVLLRRISQTRFQVPLYMDQTSLLANASAGTNVLTLDTTMARFFRGARVVIVKRSTGATPIAFQYGIIDSFTTTTMTLLSNLSADVETDHIVIPVIDCEILLKPTMQFVKAYGAQLKMTVTEVPGASQLPARGSDFPLGFSRFEGRPIFDIEPNWVAGLDIGVDHQGDRYTAGRADNTYIVGPRGRHITSYLLNMTRDEVWPVIEFFETRRGRLRSFWKIDQDQVWDTIAITTTFIDINPLGSFAQFQEEMDHIGVVLDDGTQYVREVVTIQAVLGVWRITVATALPVIATTDIRRVARARIVRFDSDTMTETWFNDNAIATRLGFIECLEEGDVEL